MPNQAMGVSMPSIKAGAIFPVKEQDQERHINNGLVEMKQEKLRFEMSAARKTDNLQGGDGSDISIWSHRRSLMRSKPGRCPE